MDKKLINEDISNMKYLFGYKPGRVISEQNIDYTTEDFSQDESELDEEGKRRPERLVKHIDTGKLVGTHKYGRGFTPNPHGEELGFEHHPSSIPNKTKFGGIEIDDFDYEDEDFDFKMSQYDEGYDELDEDMFAGWDEPETFKSTQLTKRHKLDLDDKEQDMDTGEELYPSFSSDRKFMGMSKSMGDMEIDEDEDTLFEQEEPENDRYMFFSNLQQIHRQMGILLKKDPEMISSILENGHDWAQDHIATAKESIDQVFDFLMNEEKGDGDEDFEMIMTEDKDDVFLRRRLSTIEKLIEKYINEVEEEETLFSDEYEFADNIISWVVQDLTTSEYSDHNYDELTDLVKDNFGDYILSQYVESDFDDEDDDEYLDTTEIKEEYVEDYYNELLDLYNESGFENMTPDEIEYIQTGGESEIPMRFIELDIEEPTIQNTSWGSVMDMVNAERKWKQPEKTPTSLLPILKKHNLLNDVEIKDEEYATTIMIKDKPSEVIQRLLSILHLLTELEFLSIVDCESADFSGVDICGLPELAFVNLQGTENNLEEQGYKCIGEEFGGIYSLE
jgi:hypothetical protein